MNNILEVKNLTKNYGKSRGVSDVNLEIEKGTIYGFIGPNGAGKSTTIKCIMNLINKNSGEVFIDGKLFLKKNNELKKKIGYLPSEVNLYDGLKVKEMIKYSESFYKKDCSKRISELVNKLDIDVNKKIEELSLGNLKKVGIVLALMHEPEIVIMDEASSGLDPLMQEAFYEILLEEKKKGTTIFFSSHILSEIKRICDKVAIIKEGKIINIDDMNNIEDSDVVRIKITSDYNKDIVKELKLSEDSIKNETLEFIYKDDINNLMKILSKYNIKKLLIEELDIEEIFIHYYK